MIKYEIKTERCEFRTTAHESWSAGDILAAYNRQTDFEPQLIGSFDTEEQARACYEAEKANCRTYRQRTYNGWVLIADVLSWDEAEYDEDGEFDQGWSCGTYAAPLTDAE